MRREIKKKNRLKQKSGITLVTLVITIIVLLILAGVSIMALTGTNGILTNANKAKEDTRKKGAEEKVQLAVVGNYDVNGNINKEGFKSELELQSGVVTIKGIEALVEIDKESFWVDLETGEIILLEEGEVNQPENTPEYWEVVRRTDPNWYSYLALADEKQKANVCPPVLKGEMKPIRYATQIQEGSKWANAMTADGSMWVWIPRYAYKITSGYHSSTTGTIEIAFIDTNNQFLNDTDQGLILTDPNQLTYTGDAQNEWLVHPAFTANIVNGGGFGELRGIWVAKFEASGTNASDLAIKPGVSSFRNGTVNDFYHYGKEATYGETVDLTTHMMKNSEWGAVAYLAHSQYGTNGQEVEINESSGYYTGGGADINSIYTTNQKQSTTYNATGIYDLSGGAWERTAAYINNGHSSLESGGTNAGDLWGQTEQERATSTPYKTVYTIGQTDEYELNYEANKDRKGEAIYETSSSYRESYSWNGDNSFFPYQKYPFFYRGGNIGNADKAGTFHFNNSNGVVISTSSFRTVLAPNK